MPPDVITRGGAACARPHGMHVHACVRGMCMQDRWCLQQLQRTQGHSCTKAWPRQPGPGGQGCCRCRRTRWVKRLAVGPKQLRLELLKALLEVCPAVPGGDGRVSTEPTGCCSIAMMSRYDSSRLRKRPPQLRAAVRAVPPAERHPRPGKARFQHHQQTARHSSSTCAQRCGQRVADAAPTHL